MPDRLPLRLTRFPLLTRPRFFCIQGGLLAEESFAF